MAKAVTKHRGRPGNAARQQGRSTGRAKRLLIWGGVVAVLLVGAVAIYVASGKHSTANAATVEVARSNAGGEVQAHTGPNHTVYEALAPLPTAASPRADGKPTLVWFSATTCEFCEKMQSFAHETAQGFTNRMSFVEKGLDAGGAADASRYRIQGTPTFVLIDAKGKEITRFFFASSSAEFAAAITAALQRAGV